MEVHSHTHTARKKWQHYFWEFLMLFLAVFAGFLAENQRERYVENHREKEFIRSLIIDVQLDTAHLTQIIAGRSRRSNMFDSLTLLINRHDRDQHTRDIYFFARHITRINAVVFIYNDRTMQQLKNSGSLRLIRNKKAADSIIIYDARVRALEALEDRELKYIEFCLGPCYNIFDGLVYDKMINDETIIVKPDSNYTLLNTTAQSLPEFNLTLHNVKGINRLNKRNAIQLLKSATDLLNTLNREYKLDRQ